LLLFASVKGVGSVRAALMAIAEGAVSVSLAFIVFEERFSLVQWLGVLALVGSLLIRVEDVKNPQGVHLGIPLPNIAGLRFRQVAFTKAFLKDPDQKYSTVEIHKIGHVVGSDKITTDEIEALRKMLGDDTFNQISR
jgi:hypothetical protein